MNDKKFCEKFVDISFGFQVVHHFVGLADDVTLFIKGPENIHTKLTPFPKEIQSQYFLTISILSEKSCIHV